MISVVMIGVRSHYAVPRILNDLKILNRFIIDYASGDRANLIKFIPERYRKKLNNRILPEELKLKTDKLNWIGFPYAAIINICRNNDAVCDLIHLLYGYIFKIVANIYLKNADLVYAYEGGVCKRAGSKLILEQTIAPYKTQKKILLKEAEKWPDLFKISFLKRIALNLHIKREIKDWCAADKIICPSQYVKDELINCGVPIKKISIIEYGVDLKMFKECKIRKKQNQAPLRIIFVGDMSVRKGAIYLLQCAKELHGENIQFNICGNVDLPKNIIDEYEKYLILHGRLPWEELTKCLESCDLFVFPSLLEGSAMSIIEASISGLPVICTKSSGSRIRNGIDGFIIDEVSTDALVEKISIYINNPDILSKHSENALNSRGNLSIDEYKNKLKREINSFEL